MRLSGVLSSLAARCNRALLRILPRRQTGSLPSPLSSAARRSQEAVEGYAAGRLDAEALSLSTEALIAELRNVDAALARSEAHATLLAYLDQLAVIAKDPAAASDDAYGRLKELWMLAVDARTREVLRD